MAKNKTTKKTVKKSSKKKNDLEKSRRIPTPQDDIKEATDNKTNRYRLQPHEIDIIEQIRATGIVSDEYSASSDVNVSRLRARYASLNKKYKRTLDELNNAHSREEVFMDLKNNTTEKNVTSIKPNNNLKKGKVGNSTAVMVASDWHIEEKVDMSTVNGLNSYDLDQAKKRTVEFFRKGLFLTNLIRHGININRLVLALLGDFITGYIHEELMEENHLSPTQALLYVQGLIRDGIDFLLEEGDFDEIIIPCCIGNHGRTTPKRKIASSYKNSYEWLMYYNLQDIYRNDSRIKFIVNNSYHNNVQLYNNYIIRFHHGDALRYGGGVGGITVPTNKAIAQWNQQTKVDIDVFGHFHQMHDGGKFICNGSLIGWNPYAINIKATYEVPTQTFFVVDKERGKTFVAPIFVTEPDKRVRRI